MEERLTDCAAQRGDLGTVGARSESWTLGLAIQQLRNVYKESES
jgi:hypothetical protein